MAINFNSLQTIQKKLENPQAIFLPVSKQDDQIFLTGILFHDFFH
jgi:hypothetical protein